MLYRKGILVVGVDVLKLDIRFGGENGERIRELAGRGRITPEIADSIAALAIGSRDALIQIEFLRNIDLDRFISQARKTTERVWRRGVIGEAEYTRIHRNLPFWYRELRERGIRKGDRMSYRIRDDRLHTVFLGPDGHRYVDHVGTGAEPRRAALGAYFVPGSDFRDGLITSLTDSAGPE